MGRTPPAAARLSVARTEAGLVPAQVMSWGRLYALQFSDGVIKVGVTATVIPRWRLLSWGRRPVSAICSPPIAWLHRRAEADLLRRMRRVYIGAKFSTESFSGASFEATAMLVRQVYRSYGTDSGWRSFSGVVPFKQRNASRGHS